MKRLLLSTVMFFAPLVAQAGVPRPLVPVFPFLFELALVRVLFSMVCLMGCAFLAMLALLYLAGHPWRGGES